MISMIPKRFVHVALVTLWFARVTFADNSVLDEIDSASAAIPDTLRNVLKTIDGEVEAKRVKATEVAAEKGRAQFLLTVAQQGTMNPTILLQGAGNVPRTDDAAVKKAWDQFDEAVKKWNAVIQEEYPPLVEATVKTAAEAWKQAKTAKDLEAPIATLKRLQAEQSRLVFIFHGDSAESISEAKTYLENYANLL
ncbi:MAG TPA: hypothetical protein VGH90_13485, partial [Chthoniobacteraceae bacterium]